MSNLATVPLLIFIATYLGMALGRIPGLAVDRTGIALLGAAAMLATRSITVEEAKDAVDAPTMILLFGMMVLSVQYRLAGLYTAIARRLARSASPRRILGGTIAVAAILSAVLTNDVICFALTPALIAGLRQAGLNPLPYLLALACATNIGSAATPIGNPQNILISQRLQLPFGPFVLHCVAPVLLSLGALHIMLVRAVPRRMPHPPPSLADPPATTGGEVSSGSAEALPASAGTPPAIPEPQNVPDAQAEIPEPRLLLRGQAVKAVAATAVAIVLFLTPVPVALTAMAVAGAILASRRMQTREILGLVDWHLLALFVGLFVVVRGLESSGWIEAAAAALGRAGADLASPGVLIPAAAVVGNLVGNVPAVMMLLPLTPDQPIVGYALALASTLAGNAVLVGSIANLIVAEYAGRAGVRFGFREHARVGLPITVVSLIVSAITMALWR